MAFERRFGLPPPTKPNLRVTASSGLGAIWLAPDEWLVVAVGDAAALAADLESVVRPHRGTVVDVSGQRTTLRISGPRARDVLASGCSVDVHPRFFEVGQAAQTQLARVDVILTRVAGDEYHIFVRASFARYLADWLMDALGDEGGAL